MMIPPTSSVSITRRDLEGGMSAPYSFAQPRHHSWDFLPVVSLASKLSDNRLWSRRAWSFVTARAISVTSGVYAGSSRLDCVGMAVPVNTRPVTHRRQSARASSLLSDSAYLIAGGASASSRITRGSIISGRRMGTCMKCCACWSGVPSKSTPPSRDHSVRLFIALVV